MEQKLAITLKKGLTATFFALLLVILVKRILPSARAYEESSNRLALGQEAKVKDYLALTINPPTDINFKSKQEVLAWRGQYVMQHPELLLYQYSPAKAVFEAIEDGKPWWGMKGQMFFGPGMRAIEGASEETRFLNNPYLLVQANMVMDEFPYSLSYFRNKEELANTAMPLECPPQSAYIYPLQRVEQINYDVSAFINNTSEATHAGAKLNNAKFDLVAYNAKDMGFNWLSVSKHSTNVDKTTGPINIDQYIHCGGTCGYPGGCNNMSPYNEHLFGLTLKSLPARVAVYLWNKRPANEDNADFLVILNFH